MEKEAEQLLDLKTEEDNLALLEEDVREIPLILVEKVPSGFKGYPKGTRISFKPITLGELEALNSGSMNAQRAVAMLLNSISCNTLEAQDLYYWDVMYIGIQRKLLAFGNTTGSVYGRCKKCGNLVEKKFNYTDLEFKEIDVPDLPLRMTINGEPIEFAPVTMKEFLQLEVDQGELSVYASMMKNIPYKKAKQLVDTCYGVDIKKLRFVDKQLDYGIKPFKVTCNNVKTNPNTKKQEVCTEPVIVEVKTPFEVVFPEDDFGDIDDYEVQYG